MKNFSFTRSDCFYFKQLLQNKKNQLLKALREVDGCLDPETYFNIEAELGEVEFWRVKFEKATKED